MIYTLIFVWHGIYGEHVASSGSVEFNSLTACQAAAREILRQTKALDNGLPILVCAAKGEKK